MSEIEVTAMVEGNPAMEIQNIIEPERTGVVGHTIPTHTPHRRRFFSSQEKGFKWAGEEMLRASEDACDEPNGRRELHGNCKKTR